MYNLCMVVLNMQENEKPKLEPNYTLKEPIIEYSIGGVFLLAWIILLIITGFYWGYLLFLIVPLYFLIDGFVTHRRILRFRKQKEEKKEYNNNLL